MSPPVLRCCCAVACQQTVREPLLMCVEHWRQVPTALRRQIWASYARLRKDPGAIDTHRAAVKASIDAVHGKQVKRRAVRELATRPLF